MTPSEEAPSLTDPTGREHPLTGEITTIGRALESDIVITSKRVSREHARIRREGWRAILEDLGSTNGTFLNDERVLAPTELHDTDRIAIGDVILVFHDPDITYRYEHAGEVCSKDDIGEAVWPEYHEGVYDYQVENLVRRLRAKLEPDPANPQLLLTIRGLGYKLVTRG
jgi:pSer/pThr/pTyr-binding forkhead associated (FHA) protein